jgi:hypothetical protein
MRVTMRTSPFAGSPREASNPAVEITHIRPARAIIFGDGNRWYLRGKGGAICATFGVLRHRSPQICEGGIVCNLVIFVSRSDTSNEDRAERK